MRNVIKMLSAFALLLIMTNSFAIQVNVRSNYTKLDGIGFTVNGVQHGGMGHSYQGNNMPVGAYKFGLRFQGRDIGCTTKGGKRFIKLNHDTNAMLNFNGRICIVSA